ncbi:hypothetical protein AC249_AIPGENE4848 [Exaiptasia diaphana]|nr:hypothetical protein AC249_AIPGENE4848 [Exaiptasia diaphana]
MEFVGGFRMLPADTLHVALFLTKQAYEAASKDSPKEPFPLEFVQKVVSALTEKSKVSILRFLFVLLVGYSGFYRIDELLSLTIGNIRIFDNYMSVFIRKRKNDQYREGHTLLYRSGKETCPVGISERIFRALPSDSAADSPVRRWIVSSKSSERFHISKDVNYSTIREEFCEHLSLFVDDINSFCTHSIRAGAVSNAANKDVVDKLLRLN